MIVTPLNLLTLPILVVVWTIDVYVVMTCLRLALARSAAAQGTALCVALCELTDPIRDSMDRLLRLIGRRPGPRWLPWLLSVIGMLVLRHLLLWIIASMH